MSILKVIKDELFEALFPSNGRCIFCNKTLLFETNPFCYNCSDKIHWIGNQVCEKCGKEEVIGNTRLCNDCNYNVHNYDQGMALFTYTREGKRIIQEIKYEGNKKLAKWLGIKLGNKLKDMGWQDIDLILPIPLHPNRLKERGFNQSQEIAKGMIIPTDITLINDLLIRIKDTPHQTDLSKIERQRNIKDAFRILDDTAIQDKTILLVDDVYTTGSTMNACAEVLRNAGAKKIYFAVAATGRW